MTSRPTDSLKPSPTPPTHRLIALFSMTPSAPKNTARPRHSVLWLVGIALSLWAAPLPVMATEAELPPLCSIDNAQQGRITSAAGATPEDCIEFGAAVGELGLSWRQKIPDNVRWVTRKDAGTFCSQSQPELGQKVGNPLAGGCIFLSAKMCTIVTSGYVSHATLGNAVRDCAP